MYSNINSGTLRTDNKANLAKLDGFPVIVTDEALLLHRLAKEVRLRPLLENQVLTVLADIRRKRLSGYGDTFADAQGTARVAFYAEKLRHDIKSWMKRLDEYLKNVLTTGNNDSVAARIAKELHDSLRAASPSEKIADKKDYYRMLRTVTAIQENIDHYQKQAEESGDTEPALALLIAYLKNYSSIAEIFNRRLASLPQIYLREILHAEPKTAEQDHTYVVITPTEEAGGFTLPKGTAFPAGEDLIYRTEKEEYISPMRCMEAIALYQDKNILYRHPLLRQKTERPFAHGKPQSVGWQIESPMLVLEEGERGVTVLFSLTANSILPGNLPADAFTLQLSVKEGWTQRACRYGMENGRFAFSFTLQQGEAAPTACTGEVHGITTEYPVLRILTDRPGWASRLSFSSVEIQTEVTGIRNFILCNELGEVDTTQPFQPFGIQGEHGAWFLFGNEEMGLKPLQKVSLEGNWKGVPKNRAEFDKLYREYNADADTFTVTADYRQGGEWKEYGEEQRLFSFDTDGNMVRAKIIIPAGKGAATSGEYDHDKDVFFRITLKSPSIGFGTEAYRKRFTEVMIHNSRCKKKELKEIPLEPSVPLFADVELSYTATAKTGLENRKETIIRLERITALPGQTLQVTEGDGILPFLLSAPAEHLLYFAFAHAKDEKTVRIYIDTILPGERIPFGSPQPGQSVETGWELWVGTGWQAIPPESVKAEETCGLTQSGFVEITLPEKISSKHLDRQSRIWLRAALTGDISACLAVRNVWTNCIRVKAENGDGTPLSAGTIKGPAEVDERMENVAQPLPGFGGRTAETEAQYTVRQQMRLHNRHRAVTMKDYEQIVLEHFPEVDKVQCLSIPRENASSEVCLVVFSRAEDSRYCLSPAWKLEEIRRTVTPYIPPFVSLTVVNPVYEQIAIHCKAVLRSKVQDEGKTLRQLVVLAQDYIAPWYRKGKIPDTDRTYSCKELYARMANHEDLIQLTSLKVGDICMTNADTFSGSHPWSVLLPKVNIELLSPGGGIEEAEIGRSFIIG
ncbi:hypothetical protein [uncultured Parabacteroides sp.]|uniref:hypothetical protein n=1 Tax=uncultured Parabacteroides sp. TaxID=512312 RepID=UPI0025DE2B7A|nr:hypothetical protein [uncultured Parabacteroides sp.]